MCVYLKMSVASLDMSLDMLSSLSSSINGLADNMSRVTWHIHTSICANMICFYTLSLYVVCPGVLA